MSVDPGRDPISPDSPAGTDVRYEADFLALQAEIDKLSSLSGAAGGVNWELVATLGWRIVCEQSKDILAAAWLAVAWLETQGSVGLGRGLELLAGLTENFWPELWPPLKRLRARLNAIQWWQEKTSAWLDKYQGPALEPAVSQSLRESAKNLNRLLAERSDEAPPLADLIRLIERLPVAAPEAPKPESPAVAESSAPAAEAPIAKPQDAASARQLLAEAAESFVELSLAEKDESSLGDPWLWKASRLRLWLKLSQMPPHDENKRTLLTPPPPELRGNIVSHLENGRWLAALEAAENQTGAYLFWLDLHAFCARALGALGHQAAAEAVRQEVLNLVAQWPGLEKLAFNDGSPLADAETRLWLSGPQTEAASAPAGPLAKVDELLAAGDNSAALSALTEALEGADGEEKFRLRLRQLELLLRAGRRRTAAGLADTLMAQLEAQNLAQWQPALALEALSVLHQVYRQNGPERAAQLRLVSAGLAAVSPASVETLPPEED